MPDNHPACRKCAAIRLTFRCRPAIEAGGRAMNRIIRRHKIQRIHDAGGGASGTASIFVIIFGCFPGGFFHKSLWLIGKPYPVVRSKRRECLFRGCIDTVGSQSCRGSGSRCAEKRSPRDCLRFIQGKAFPLYDFIVNFHFFIICLALCPVPSDKVDTGASHLLSRSPH